MHISTRAILTDVTTFYSYFYCLPACAYRRPVGPAGRLALAGRLRAISSHSNLVVNLSPRSLPPTPFNPIRLNSLLASIWLGWLYRYYGLLDKRVSEVPHLLLPPRPSNVLSGRSIAIYIFYILPSSSILLRADRVRRNIGIGVDVHVQRITNRLGWHKPQAKDPEQVR
jgi:hypothetical protein